MATPTLNPNGGWFLTEQPVTISCATSGATIRYTTNGLTPTSLDRTVASGGTVLIDRPLTLKANAFKAGMTTSATATAVFTISGKVAGGTSHSVALKSDGTVWTFGANVNGQLGIGSADANTHPTPLQVKTNATTFLTGMSVAGAGALHSMAVRQSDGSVFGWGSDSAGQLGDNSAATQQNYPVQAKTTAAGNPLLLAIVDISGGALHSVGLKSDGTVWTWGNNASRQLGDGTTTSRKLAAQVKTGTSTFLTGVVAIASGENFAAAVKSDGTVWTWGLNTSGQLGVGSTTVQNYAVQVKLAGGANLTGVREIACGATHAIALKTDGTVWAWGNNGNGRLGNGTTTQANNPVQVKTNSSTFLTSVNAVAAGASHSFALKTDGTVFSWGLNSSGQLSVNSTTQKLYATQATSSAGVNLTGVVDLGCGANHSLVTRNDGTVSGAGLNSSGQAGYPTTTFNPLAATPLGNFLAITAFADPDADGLLTWQEREIGTNPNLADTDGDGMPDGWEFNTNLNPLVNDAAADPDGDGFTNLYEYQHGTNPFDYYNGLSFNLNIISGNNQWSPGGLWLSQPLVIRTTNVSGGNLINAPVTFSLGQAAGAISLTSGGTSFSSMDLRTDGTGQAAVYYQQPATGTASSVLVQAGTGSIQQVTFNATISAISPSGLKLWLKSDTGITKDANGFVSAWADSSGNSNHSTQGTSSYEPQWLDNSLNGKPILRFDGIDDQLVAATSGGADNFTVIAVAKTADTHEIDGEGASGTSGTSGQRYLFGALYPEGAGVSLGTNGISVYEHAGGYLPALAVYDGPVGDSFNIVTVKYTSRQPQIFLNGYLARTGVTSALGTVNAPTEIGSGGYGAFGGDMAEVIIYDHVLSDSERLTVESYLNQRYNLVSVPPAPANVTASVVSPTQVTVSWDPQGLLPFKIERKTGSGGSYAQIGATTKAGATFYNDNTLSAGIQYFYRVRTSNLAGDSSYSSEISVTTPATGATLPTSGLQLWLRSQFGITKDSNDFLSKWEDSSGNGNDSVQNTASSKPQWIDNSLLGQPVIHFDGIDDQVVAPSSPGSDDFTIFAVTRAANIHEIDGESDSGASGTSGQTYLFGAFPGGAGVSMGTNGISVYEHGGGYMPALAVHQGSVGNYHNVVAVKYTARQPQIFLNGALVRTGLTSALSTVTAPTEIGSGSYGAFGGDVAEVLIYDRSLTQAETDAVTSYCQQRYGLVDSDGDGLLDAREAELGTNPQNADTDGDGIPDGAEVNLQLNPLVNDASLDPDGDGFTNLQEYQNATDPFDYFNGASFNLDIDSGNGQKVSAGAWLPQPLVVEVTDGTGAVLSNAPVTFAITQSGGALSATSGGTQVSSLDCRTDGTGKALVYYKAPATERLAVINAEAGSAGNIQQVNFTASTIDATFPFLGLKLWLRGDAGVVKDASNAISQWIDGTGSGNDALQSSVPNAPLHTGNSISGKPVVRFDGVDDMLSLGDVMQGATAGELFVVLKATGDPGATHGFMSFGPGGWGQWASYPDAGGYIHDNFGSGLRNTGHPAQALDQFHLYNALSTPDEWTSRINGLMQYTTDSNTVGFTTTPVIGSGGSPFNGPFQGDIAEIIVYDHALSPAERDTVEQYLGAKYPDLAAPPAVPAMLQGAAISPTQASLSWVYEMGNVSTFFNVERKSGSGAFQEIAVTRDSASYIDSSAVAGASYVYRVRASNYSGQSGYSAELSIATPSLGTAMPLTEMRLWLKADAGTTSPMISWANQSPNGGHALQGGADNQPAVIPTGISGKPAVRFDGVSDMLALGDVMEGATEGELFVVLKATGDPGVTHGFMTFGPGGWGQWASYPDAGGNIHDNFGSGLRNTGNPAQALEQFHLYNTVSRPGEWTSRINGLVQYTTNSNTAGFTTAPVIGSSGSPFNGPFRGDIAEIIVYDRALSQAERGAVERYIGAKYPALAPQPSIPSAFQAIGISPTQVSLSWTYDLGNVTTMFIIERSDNGGPFVQIAVVFNSGSYIDSSIPGPGSYTYRIRAVNYTGTSDYTSDVPVTTPATGPAMPLTGIRLWLKADAGTTSPMISWTSQSPDGEQALQGAADNQPVVIPSGINGKPVVRFDGVNDLLGLGDVMEGATAGELFVVLKATGDPGVTHGFMAFGPGGWGQWASYPDAGGYIHDNFGSGLRNTGHPAQALDQFHLYNALSTPDEWTSRINGLMQYTTDSNTVGFTTTPVIGSGGSPFDGPFQGDIAEIIVYDHALSPAERDAVEQYLGTKYPDLAPPPAVPAMLQGAAISPTQVSLSWVYDLGNVFTFFNVERKSGSGAFQEIAVTRDSASYIDSSAVAEVSYTYRVRATNYSGQSGYSAELSITAPSLGAAMPLTGMRLWLKADAGTTSPMISWANQSPNGGQALQGGAGNQPVVIADGIGGKPAVRFDGVGDMLALGDVMEGATEGELFVVLKATGDAGTPHGFMAFGTGGWGQWANYPDANGNIQDNFGSTTIRGVGHYGQDLDQFHLYNAVSKPGEWTARINGLMRHTGSSNTVGFTTAPGIGSSGSPFNGPFRGDIAEVIIYDHTLTLLERERVQWYLAHKYLIPGYDLDDDGLTNAQEQALGTDPLNWDTNGDGISDGNSHAFGIDPANLDNDGDGIQNAAELALGTNPFNTDTDGDGVPDGTDAFPLDPSRWQLPFIPGDSTPPGISLFEPAGATPIP